MFLKLQAIVLVRKQSFANLQSKIPKSHLVRSLDGVGWRLRRRRAGAAKRPSLSFGDPTAAGAGEDRLSALPDDVLVLIPILRLSTRAAARTSVLCRRWRRVWSLLPELDFGSATDPHQIGPTIQAHKAALRCLFVDTLDAPAKSVAAWLPVAASRLSGCLFFQNVERERSDEDEAPQSGAFELPCLERATEVSLHLGFLGLAVPPAGVFARLSDLCLSSVRLQCPGLLGDAVSWPRCPCLQKLTVRDAWGLDNLTIHSNSLQKVELIVVRSLRELTIAAPALEHLKVMHCFYYSRSQPVASITAPQLATLDWMDPYDPSSVHLGKMEHLRLLRPFFFIVYGLHSFPHNQSCLSLLQRFKVIESIILTLAYAWDLDSYQYMMEDMTMLLGITILHLNVLANTHSFGAATFHVLRMCSGIRRLMLTLLAPTEGEAQTACPPGCICGEQQNWETEQLLLNRLQEVEITRLKGSEHEFAFVKQLFSWATALEKMTITFDDSVTETVANELCLLLLSFSKPEICMEIHTYEDMIKVMMYAPED